MAEQSNFHEFPFNSSGRDSVRVYVRIYQLFKTERNKILGWSPTENAITSLELC